MKIKIEVEVTRDDNVKNITDEMREHLLSEVGEILADLAVPSFIMDDEEETEVGFVLNVLEVTGR